VVLEELQELLRLFTVTDLVDMLVIIVVVLALNLMAGYAGIPNFGMAVFVYIGAFALAGIGTRVALLLVQYVDPNFIDSLSREHLLVAKYRENLGALLTYGIAGDTVVNRVAVPAMERLISQDLALSLLLVVIVFGSAIVLGALTGIIASFAAVRLREDYLAIALLAFSELTVSVVFDQTDALAGGPNGAWAVRPWPSVVEEATAKIAPHGVSPDVMVALLVALVVFIATFIYAERVANSPMGRMLRAMRDDDLAISTYGRDVAITRLKVMAIGAAIASVAGAIYATIHMPVKATDYNRVDWTFVPWAMMILGGMANNWGVILGAIAIYVGKRLIHYYTPPLVTGLASALELLPRPPSWLVILAVIATIAIIASLRALPQLNVRRSSISKITTIILVALLALLLARFTIGAMAENIDYVRALLPNIFVGVLIILILYLRPQGLVPERPSKTLGRREMEELAPRRQS